MRIRRLLPACLAAWLICCLGTTTACADQDTDRDGIPDAWETQYGFQPNNPLDANNDPDGDGVSNLNEHIAGTNPLNPASFHPLVLDIVTSGFEAQISFPTVGGNLYEVQFADEPPGPWSTFTQIAGTGTRVTVSDSLFNQRRFYRVRDDQLFSLNIVGYISVPVFPGTNVLAVPFFSHNHTVGALFPSVAADTCIFKTGQPPNCFFDLVWDIPAMFLARGELFDYVAPVNENLLFVGQLGSAPVFTQQPDDLLVSGLFSVETVSPDPPRYQWRKNGVNIFGETNIFLFVDGDVPADAGTYAVLAANDDGAVASRNALVLRPEIPIVAGGNNFTNRARIFNTSGLIAGNNVGANKQAGEPNHAGKPGGKSVWYVWQAPATGIATFRTSGSQFDTLLAVYTGLLGINFTNVASDEDRGGFVTSEVSFNTSIGVDYAIAIDGFGGASGDFLLEWQLEAAGQTLPVILAQPQSRSVAQGSNVTFTVSASGSGGVLRYQWFFNGNLLAGATGPTLVRNNAQAANVGYYTVLISNSVGRTVLSLPAALEISSVPGALTEAKAQDLPGPPPFAGSAAFVGGVISVSAGTIGSHIFSTVDSTNQPAPANSCGVLGGAGRWFKLMAGASGTMVLDTQGSSFDTALMVFTGANPLLYVPVACNDNATNGVTWSSVRFPAVGGVEYSIIVDGANADEGTAKLNWGLGSAPVYTGVVTNPVVKAGSNLVLRAAIGGTPTPTYYWYLNGSLFAQTTVNQLEISSASSAHAGVWSVAASNFVGQTSNVVANVRVAAAFRLNASLTFAGGMWKAHLSGTNQSTIIEGNTNLTNPSGWIPLYTNSVNTPLNFLDTPSAWPRRFYRAVPGP
jgi:hypothetical protein